MGKNIRKVFHELDNASTSFELSQKLYSDERKVFYSVFLFTWFFSTWFFFIYFQTKFSFTIRECSMFINFLKSFFFNRLQMVFVKLMNRKTFRRCVDIPSNCVQKPGFENINHFFIKKKTRTKKLENVAVLPS